jgi:hypothetical protein
MATSVDIPTGHGGFASTERRRHRKSRAYVTVRGWVQVGIGGIEIGNERVRRLLRVVAARVQSVQRMGSLNALYDGRADRKSYRFRIITAPYTAAAQIVECTESTPAIV